MTEYEKIKNDFEIQNELNSLIFESSRIIQIFDQENINNKE